MDTEDWKLLGIGAVFFAVLIAGLVSFCMLAAQAGCSAQATQMNVPHTWGVWSDCMVQIDGKWVPLSNYRQVGR